MCDLNITATIYGETQCFHWFIQMNSYAENEQMCRKRMFACIDLYAKHPGHKKDDFLAEIPWSNWFMRLKNKPRIFNREYLLTPIDSVRSLYEKTNTASIFISSLPLLCTPFYINNIGVCKWRSVCSVCSVHTNVFNVHVHFICLYGHLLRFVLALHALWWWECWNREWIRELLRHTVLLNN